MSGRFVRTKLCDILGVIITFISYNTIVYIRDRLLPTDALVRDRIVVDMLLVVSSLVLLYLLSG